MTTYRLKVVLGNQMVLYDKPLAVIALFLLSYFYKLHLANHADIEFKANKLHTLINAVCIT